MPDSADTFSCLACNRRYRWIPAIAGKSLRCKCGQPISVPPAPGMQPQPISYSPTSGTSENTVAELLAHPIRNFAIPIIYAALIIFCLIDFAPQLFPSTAVAVGFCIVTVGSALIVTGGIFIYGLIKSARFEIPSISFALGSFKILTVIVLADAAIVALGAYGVNTGALTRHMYMSLGVMGALLVVFFGVAAAVVWAASFAVFHYHEDDFVSLGFPLSAGGWVAHFIIVIAYLICANVYLKHLHAPPPTPPSQSSPANSATP